MFGPRHYVAAMRTKPAELRALETLHPKVRPWVTPLLECPVSNLRDCRSAAELQEKMIGIAHHISGWSGQTVFFDFAMVRSVAPLATEMIAAEASRIRIRPAVVVGLKTDAESPFGRSIRNALNNGEATICLRVSVEELKLPSGHRLIESCLRRYGASASSAHLIIDRGGINKGSLAYPDFVEAIPWLDSWQSLTLLAGSFPQDLSKLAAREIHPLERHEWKQWRQLGSFGGRRPAFGDFCVQHVVYKEPVVVPNFSASVRYTLEDKFLVLRGEGVLNEGGPGYKQWNGWAAMLVEMPEFFGATFSAGDNYIAERARSWGNTGNATTWLQAGFSHHLTITALQVAAHLEDVRQLTTRATSTHWSSMIDISQPGATA